MLALPWSFQLIDPHNGRLHHKTFEFARFAIPRRAYTNTHLEYVAKVMKGVKEQAPENKGYCLTEAPEFLSELFAKYEPIV